MFFVLGLVTIILSDVYKSSATCVLWLWNVVTYIERTQTRSIWKQNIWLWL